MFELALFPLQTVLFPGIPLRLLIFEERYKKMINYCMEQHQPFGVVLIRKGVEALGPLAEPHAIGCTAQIVDTQPLEEGRINLTGIGHERFRILSLNREIQPYLVGNVELYPLLNPDPGKVIQAGSRLRYWVKRYLRILVEAGNGQFDFNQLPDDPVALAYLAASLTQLSPLQKQRLLARPDALDLLAEVQLHFRRETALVKAILSKNLKEQGVFSLN
jgi:uncharacterized protein